MQNNMKTESEENTKYQDAGAQPHDRGYKKILKNRRIFLHTLRKYTDFSWAADICEEDIEYEDKEYVTDKFSTYESDLICRIRHGEQEIYLFILMELQSKVDFSMPFRLLVYMVDIWEQYFRNVPEEERTRKEFRLPVVVPLVLYNGKYNWTAERRFRNYLMDGKAYGEYGVDFHYALIDVRRLEEDAILDTNTVIDNVFYLDRAKDTRDFLKAVGSIMDRVGALPPDERNLMEVWFDNVLSGMFGEKEREFIRDCFMRGEKKMISGFEQIMIEERERAEFRGLKRGEEIGQRRGEEIGLKRGEEIGGAKEREEGIRRMIELCAELSLNHKETVAKLLGKYELSQEAAQKYVERFWPSDAAEHSTVQ